MSASRHQSGRWVTVLVIAVFVSLIVGSYCLFDWLSDQSPWFSRIAFGIIGIAVGGKIGKALSGNRAHKTGPNWIFLGVLFLSIGLAIYFGIVRPVQRDRERDEAFVSIRDELRASTERLVQLAAEAPDANDRPAVKKFLGSMSAEGDVAIALMQKAHDQFKRFTTEQQNELIEESKKATEAQRRAREKIGEQPPKKKE